jgi:hypothetical protein
MFYLFEGMGTFSRKARQRHVDLRSRHVGGQGSHRTANAHAASPLGLRHGARFMVA